MTEEPGMSKAELRAELAANEARAKSLRPWYRKKRFILLGVFVGIVVLGSIASRGKNIGSSTASEVAAATEPSVGVAGEADDVTVSGPCELSEFGLAEMPIKIVNNSSKASSYFVEGVVERNGVKVGDMNAASSNVAPGQTALDKLVAISVEGSGPVTCRVVKVDRMAA